MDYSKTATMITTLNDNDLKIVPLLRTLLAVIPTTYHDSTASRGAVSSAAVASSYSSSSGSGFTSSIEL